MKKQFIIILLALVCLFSLSGCYENRPSITIHRGGFANEITIDIGNPYIYEGFDIENNDGKKDVILHFEVEDEG